MPRRYGLFLFFAMCALFLIANRGAYKGYFQDDEIDNIQTMRRAPAVSFFTALASPRFQPNNFRPAGHAYFRLMEAWSGLDFPKYVAVIHIIHFVNIWLVWLVARRLGLGLWPSAAAAVLFAFHMAAFDVYWKPMYVFDLLCAALSLASLLLYMRGRWLWSLAAFWLAYKAKELAVMLPLVLLLWEWSFGGKQWKRLIPFFGVSLLFGLQGVLLNPNVNNDYTLRFTPAAIWTSLRYYAGQILLIPYAGFVLLLPAWLVRDRAVRFGLAAMALFFVPLLFLPGRLFSAYCYLPLAGLALAGGALAARYHPAFAAAFLALWLPWNMAELRARRRQALAIADENRAYMSSVAEFARNSPVMIESAVYSGAPAAFHRWGVEAALRYFTRPDLPVCEIADPCPAEMLEARSMATFSWDPNLRRLLIARRVPGEPEASYITMDRSTPIWQLTSGWYPLENRFRWTRGVARARLERPAGAREFEVVVNAGPMQLRDLGRITLSVSLDGRSLGRREFVQPGHQTARWPLPEGKAGPVQVEFRSDPEYRPAGDPRELGVAIVSFGFVAQPVEGR